MILQAFSGMQKLPGTGCSGEKTAEAPIMRASGFADFSKNG